MTISPEGGRVLGCLVEKQFTTPQQYPLSRNSLSLACSQATNREPLMTLDEEDVQRALQELKELHLVRFVLPSHGKSVTRYRQVLDECYGLDTVRLALVAVLLLRGPQTVGELRTRTGRMVEFPSVDAVHGELEILAGHPEPLVRLLPRRPGQKEVRWQQLLAAEPGPDNPDPVSTAPEEPDQSPQPWGRADDPGRGGAAGSCGPGDRVDGLGGRLEVLEAEMAALRDQVVDLGGSLDALRHSLGE